MERTWTLTDNVFEKVTRHNFLKMEIISSYSDEYLFSKIADPFYNNLYSTFFHPERLNYMGKYDLFVNLEGLQVGDTDAFKKYREEQVGKLLLNAWDAGIQMFYPKGSSHYLALFPNGHGNFQHGRINSVMAAVSALSITIGSDPSLASVKTSVDTAISTMTGFKNAHSASMGGKKDASRDTEDQRLPMADIMFLLYANLAVKFYNDLKKIEPFFDLVNIRNHHQTVFDRVVAANSSETFCKHTFHADDRLMVFDDSDNAILIGVTAAKNQTVVNGFGPGAHLTVTDGATSLGNIATNKFLTVTNPGSTPAHVVITLL